MTIRRLQLRPVSSRRSFRCSCWTTGSSAARIAPRSCSSHSRISGGRWADLSSCVEVTSLPRWPPLGLLRSTSVRTSARYARERECRLRDVAEVRTFPGIAVVEPGSVAPAGRDHYRVFTPYFRAWEAATRRASTPPIDPRAASRRASIPACFQRSVRSGVDSARRRAASEVGRPSDRARLARFLRSGLSCYDGSRDQLASDGSSMLSPYLRFGCVSPLELARRAARTADGACVRTSALLARLLPPTPGREPAPRGRRSATSWRRLERRPGRTRRLAGRQDRCPDRGCRHASASRRGLDAQPSAAAGRLVPGEAPANGLAARRGPLLRLPRRRRPGEQFGKLAVGGRNRNRRATKSRLQSDRPGAALRSRRHVCPHATCPSSPSCRRRFDPRAVAARGCDARQDRLSASRSWSMPTRITAFRSRRRREVAR